MYNPYPWQQDMHNNKAKLKFVQAGRRAGKTRSALHEALSAIKEASLTPVQFPNDKRKLTSDEAGLVPPIHVWTVAPTRAQMLQVWNEMQTFIPKHLVREKRDRQAGGRGGGFKHDELNVWLDFKNENGSWLNGRWRKSVFWELKSADNPEGLQTVGLDFLHMAEAQDIKEAAWNKVRPTLNSPGRLGRAIIEGIPPESTQHWFARNFKVAKLKKSVRRAAFHASTFDNPHLTDEDKEEIKEEKATLTENIWERFYLAQQPEGAGNFFRNLAAAYTKADSVELARPVDGRFYVAGLDLGRTNDPTVMIIKDRQSRTSVSAVELKRTDWALQVETIKREASRWNVQEIYMDSTGLGGKFGEDVLYRELMEESIPVVGYNFTQAKKYQLFLDYAISLEKETVAFPQSWSKLISQLEDIAHRESANRGHTFYTVSSGHDDWVDAECLALMACDPAMDIGEQKFIPASKKGITPINSGYSGKMSRLKRWRKARQENEQQEAEIINTEEKKVHL